jgi:CubicO group peptidase (beta-lactamase class C family)
VSHRNKEIDMSSALSTPSSRFVRDQEALDLHVFAAPTVQGTVAPGFEPVRDALARNLESGDDIGASAAVLIDGQVVVDIWGGYFDGTFTRPWERDTIICTHSTTKTMSAMAALLLADRGEIDLDAPVARYWPEFAAQGKENVLVKQLISHTSGLAGWTENVTWEDVYDLEKSTDLLARQAPWWKPGTASGYHGITLGHLIHGVIQRVTGKTLGQFFNDEIAGPLGADYHIGTGPDCDSRVAPFVQSVPNGGANGNPMHDQVALYPPLHPRTSSSVPFRRAEIGAANGHGNARGVATIHSALVADEVNGVRLLSKAGRRRVLEPQSNGIDLILDAPMRWGMGFALESPLFDNVRGHTVAYWGGNGGSLGLVDFDERMTVSFVMNRWVIGAYEFVRNQRILKAAYDCLLARR